MIKKFLPIVLCLCLIFSIGVKAENSTNNDNTQAPDILEEIPMQEGGRQGGGRTGFEKPPNNVMPNGEMAPPQFEEGNVTESDSQITNDTAVENGNRIQKGGFKSMDANMQSITQNTETAEKEGTNGVQNIVKTYTTPIIAVILLIFAFIFVIVYKRKCY